MTSDDIRSVEPITETLQRALHLAETASQAGVDLARTACQAARAKNLPSLAEALLTLGMTLVQRERFGEALETLEEARDTFIRQRNEIGILRCEWQIGIVRRFQSHLDEAVRLLEGAVVGLDRAGLVDEAARARRDLAIAYNLLERWEEAATLLEEARTFFSQAAQEIQVARCDLAEGTRLRLLNRYREAIPVLESALTVFRSAEHTVDVAKVLLMLGMTHGQLQADEESLLYYLEAEQIFDTFDLPLRRAYVNLFIGSVLWRLGRIHEARKRLESALAWFEAQDMTRDEADCYLNLGNLAYIEGENKRASSAYRQSLALYTQLGLNTSAAWCERNLALIAIRKGRLDEALDRLHRAADTLNTQGVTVWAADCHYKMAEIYTQLEQQETAMLHLEQAWKAYRDEDLPLSAAWCELLKAKIVDWEKTPNILTILEDVRSAIAAMGLTWHLGLCDRHIGDLLLEHGYVDLAWRRYEDAQHLFDEMGAEADAAISQVGIGQALAQAGHGEEAARLLHTALEAIAGTLPEWSWQAYATLGDIARQEGKSRQALAFYQDAIRALYAVRTTLPEEELAGAFATSTRGVYERAILLAIELDELTEALTIAEESRAQILQQSLRNLRSQPPLDEYTEKLYARETALRVRITLLRQQLGLTGGAPAHTPPEDAVEHLADLRACRSEHRRLLQQIHATTHRPFGTGEPFDWDRFRSVVESNLPSGWTALVYQWLGEKLLIFHVTSKEVTTFLRQPGRIERAALEMCTSPEPERRMLVLHDRLPGGAAPSPVGQKYRQLLYRFLIPEEVAQQLAPDRLLLIVPHGDLHQLPFQVLESEAGFLAEHALIAYTPSLGALETLLDREPIEEGSETLLVGIDTFTQPKIPLDWTSREIEELSAHYGAASVCLTNEEATREKIQMWDETGRLENFKIVHIASHATLDTASGALTGITLWDGDLTPEDIGRLRLGPATVVLSACQSGLGEIHPGDEIISLPHAFFAAGARTVVVSHWHVDDEGTADLMVAFHKRLRAGMSPARALTDTQRAFLNRGLTPYEWGGFVVMGVP